MYTQHYSGRSMSLTTLAVVTLLTALAGLHVPSVYAIDSEQGLVCVHTTTGSISASPTTIHPGQSVTLSWRVQLPNGCPGLQVKLNGQVVHPSGQKIVTPSALPTTYPTTQTYALIAVMGLNKAQISTASVTVLCPPTPSANGVIFYTGTDYSGTCVIKGLGAVPNSTHMGIADNALSSVKVGANAQVVVCQHTDYHGNCQLFTKDVPNMATTNVGYDTASSAVVMKKTHLTLLTTLFSGRAARDDRVFGPDDQDRDGLKDSLEGVLADAFRPVLVFDADENARRPSEPYALFQVRPLGCVGQGCPGVTRIVIRWAFLFARDGGYNDSICSNDHDGDNDKAAYVLQSANGGVTWHLVEVHVGKNPTPTMPYQGKIVWPHPEDSPEKSKAGWLETSSANPTRPRIYQSASKHHQYLHAGDWGDSPYSDVPWWDNCSDDVDGNGVQVSPGLKSVGLPNDRWNNVGEPEAHPESYFVGDISHLFVGTECHSGLHAWSHQYFCGSDDTDRNHDLWVQTPITFQPLRFTFQP
jgi:hypothetical protein